MVTCREEMVVPSGWWSHNGRFVREHTQRRRAIWSEHVPLRYLRGTLLDLLARRGMQLIVAIEPRTLDLLPALVERCGEAGLSLGLWPLLDDRDGRWPSEANARGYGRHLERVLDATKGLPAGSEIVFDLEPPIDKMRRLLTLRRGEGRVWRSSDFDVAATRYADLAAFVQRHGLSPTAVVPPMVLLDPKNVRGGWQRLLGTPVDGVGFERVSVMLYTSLIEGYARGTLGRAHVRRLLWDLTRRAHRRWGQRASIALGVVGGGALGDERPYRGLEELIDDVAIAQRAGGDGLSLFGLTGVLGRDESPEQWLDAFVETPPALHTPRPTCRTRALLMSATIVGRVCEWRARHGGVDVLKRALPSRARRAQSS